MVLEPFHPRLGQEACTAAYTIKLPRRGWRRGLGVAPRTGFEPATSCSGGSISIPDEDQGSLNLSTFGPTWRLAA